MASPTPVQGEQAKDPILSLLDSQGPFKAHLKGFEVRAEQQQMMANILSAYRRNHIALIEAGTGIGKSLAYLLPAVVWSQQRNEKTLISTATIALQEQLLHKDLPLIKQALGIDFKVVLVKGMGNYLCLNRFEEVRGEFLLLSDREREEIQAIDAWSQTTKDGTRATLPIAPSADLWDRVKAESDACSRERCPFFKQCHFFKARQETADAHLLISNHHMLFADLNCRLESENFQNPALLPAYQRLILDEAHHLENIATEYFADRLGLLELLRLLGRLQADNQQTSHQGKLTLFKERLEQFQRQRQNPCSEIASLLTHLHIDFASMRQQLQKLLVDTFSAMDTWTQFFYSEQKAQEEEVDKSRKLRLRAHHYTHPFWQQEVQPRIQQLAEEIKRYCQAIVGVENRVKNLDYERLNEYTELLRAEILNLTQRLTQAGALLENLAQGKENPERVRWIEIAPTRVGQQVCVIDAKLNIAPDLAEGLFKRIPSTVLCSATLTSHREFAYVRSRLGLTPEFLPQHHIEEKLYDSPFDYKNQLLLGVPTDIPEPHSNDFVKQAAERIAAILKITRGHAFILFTSFQMLHECYGMLQSRLKAEGLVLLKQGEANRSALIQRFKQTPKSVIFGTDSFWEGVDVVGDALRCVIIVKLPFQVPTEPLIEARVEAIAARGGNPFMEYSLPQAIVKFKQGFGRLIRHRKDRGCVICLDPRISTKRYGTLFLQSLPPSRQFFGSSSDLLIQMANFYKERS